MIYEVPIETISRVSTIVDIVNIRNKIGKSKIPGEDGMLIWRFKKAYAPGFI